MIALVLTVALVALSINPVSPLKNWTIRTDKTEYTEGDAVKIVSTYDKDFSIDGKSLRTLTCIIGPRTQEYAPVNQDTNKFVGKNLRVESTAIIPRDVIDSLPKECYYKFDNKYNIYGFESSGRSNTFTVKSGK